MLKYILIFLSLISALSAAGQDPGPYTMEDTRPLLYALKKSIADTNHVQLLLRLSDQYYYRLNAQPADIDKALFYTLEAKKLSISLTFHKGEGTSELQLSRILPKRNEKENGRKAAMKAISIFTKYKEYFQLGEAYYTLAGYYSLSGKEINQRISLAEKSSEAFGKAGNKEKQGHIYMQLGDLYLNQGALGNALSALKQSLVYFQATNSKELKGVYDLLGITYLELGSANEAVEYGLLAVHTAKMHGDTSSIQLCTFYNRLGNNYEALGDYKKALDIQRKALKLALRFRDQETIHTIASNVAGVMIRLGLCQQALALLKETEKKYPLKSELSHVMVDRRYIDIYRKLKLTSLGQKYSERLEQIALSPMILEGDRRHIYSSLIPFYFDSKDYKKLEAYLKLSKALALKARFRIHLYNYYLWSAKLDSAKGNYIAAFEKYQKYSVLKDSVFNENKARQISQLEIIFEVEKKNDSIQYLTKQSMLQSEMLRQAGHIQDITYVSIGMLLIIIALLIAGYLLMRRNNRNITVKQNEINRKNISLEHLVNEKEWLIKEIHHRVKNNLHMVAGLLDSQSEFLKSEEARSAIADSHHRIQSMSMIHQKLYQTENLSTIDMSAYIHEMVQYLKDSFKLGKNIIFVLDIDRVEMDISHSIPLGLIMNEAITNSIKYAFPNYRNGKITISLKQCKINKFSLIISDNGIGLNKGFDIRHTNSFGLTLIQGLSDDIGGKLYINTDSGTTIEIEFDYEIN
jgi:two-component sensor histidine kinase